MDPSHITKIAQESALKESQVWAVAQLLDSGATLPFIARYRKEATEGLDEVAIAKIRDQLSRLRQLDERRLAMVQSLAKRDLLTPDLKERLLAARTLAELEDIYLPFRPKRRTRATVAREKGLENLARTIFAQERHGDLDLDKEAALFINAELGVESTDEALAGARDIIAEWISEDAECRARTRALFEAEGVLRSKAAADKELLPDAEKFKDYLDWSQPIGSVTSHRLLAMMRSAKSGMLSLHVAPPDEEAHDILDELFLKGDGPASQQVRAAARDGYRRLLAPSMESEALASARARAEEKAIAVFSDNLRQILLDPPLGQKAVLAVDPGFRTGCKLAVLDRLGRLVKNDVVYPHETQKKTAEAARLVKEICDQFEIEVIAVGNGTAGRETEAFLRGIKFSRQIPVIMVNESGASVYSTSDIARQEFPHQDATVRGAISIGRRLMDRWQNW